ncbi:methyl-accepting chemotaxis protein [Sphingomonas leidyi]|uniref:Methyl-accepting chemotaxis protein n=2 Tax=Sphingomonas leidyi TaxID=68569 RepID=A0A7X5UY04_9SPHN|nr:MULTISPECIES: methyl-accepting chemotaxis protein [Sphingomonas]MBN8810904.1 CHASE3 domain-containing protein [Sphingomonas sp.]NIJ64355.1 methyl-accepting chemotaxis protein [Sphingomonas leidyi]OJY49220.1 MAG: methyl-accepting chemotaxis protein [Sphingomonas sp. 67-41]
MNIQDMPIPRKLAAAFVALVCIFAGIGWLLFSSLQTVGTASEDKERAFDVTASSDQIMMQILEGQSAVRAYVILRNPDFLATYQDSRKKIGAAAEAFRSQTKVPEQRARLDKLVNAVQELDGKLDHMITLARNPATQAEAQQLAGVKQLGAIREIMGEIDRGQHERVASTKKVEADARAGAVAALTFGGAFGIAIAVLLGWLLTTMIARPIKGMTSLMGRLAGGENTIEVPGTERKDEVGGMAKAVLVFRDAAVAKEKADAAKLVAEAEQRHVVTELTTGLDNLAKGDLTTEISSDFAPEYGALKTNFNSALAALRTLIGSVVEGAASIRTGSGEIAQASEDLARRTESNAASLEETSAAISQMDDRLKATAKAAGSTLSRANQAIATVGDGRSVADDAVQAMTRVSESAKGIDSVIEGLDKIAFQTRVLAMNAAVEAGRAGEAGRGFAVVADLVSALAMRAEEEAGRARDQLTATQADIVDAVAMVQKVDGALVAISGDVDEVHDLLANIAADNEAQSSAVTQIAVAIGTMDQATQQNAAMVEETSAASRNLSSEVQLLSEQASAFNIGAGQAPPRRPAPAASGIREKVAPGYVSPVKPLPAAAVSALTRADDWASF